MAYVYFGSLILILSGLVLNSGMRFYLTTQKVVITGALIGSGILILVLIPYSHDEFVASFNAIIGPTLGEGITYESVIASGRENGWGAGWEGGIDWKQTWLVATWPFLQLR